jgi:Subtilase family
VKINRTVKLFLSVPLLLAALFLARDHLAYYLYYNTNRYYMDRGYQPDKFPEAITEKDFAVVNKMFGFMGKDFSAKDLSRLSAGFLAYEEFDSHTLWPKAERLPDGFAPGQWIQTGKDPGLNLRAIHEQGITGQGVAVAIIDKNINPEHQEISARIHYNSVKNGLAKKFQYKKHFHGIGCASILCGKECGVAPGAELYYFGVPDDTRNFHNYCLAMEMLIDVNDALPEGRKIRAVSISDGSIDRKDKELSAKWEQALKRTEENNIAVIYPELQTTLAIFTCGGSLPFADKNNPDSYEYSDWVKDWVKERGGDFRQKLILPSDFRATANNKDDSTFAYRGTGGFSWSVPYLTGLAALAWGIDPELSIDDIYALLKQTKTVNSMGNSVVNPEGFIKVVSQGAALRTTALSVNRL